MCLELEKQQIKEAISLLKEDKKMYKDWFKKYDKIIKQ